MKKVFLLALLATASISAFSQQSFTFKRCFVQAPGLSPSFIKMQGEISITDSTINILQNGTVSNIKVYKTGSNQFKCIVNEDAEMRFTLAPNTGGKKDEDYIFVMEGKDKFTNQNISTMYYLTSK
jgi:hypothetical protein